MSPDAEAKNQKPKLKAKAKPKGKGRKASTKREADGGDERKVKVARAKAKASSSSLSSPSSPDTSTSSSSSSSSSSDCEMSEQGKGDEPGGPGEELRRLQKTAKTSADVAEEDAASTLVSRSLGEEIPEKKAIDPHKNYNAKLERELRMKRFGEKPLEGTTGYVPAYRLRNKSGSLS